MRTFAYMTHPPPKLCTHVEDSTNPGHCVWCRQAYERERAPISPAELGAALGVLQQGERLGLFADVTFSGNVLQSGTVSPAPQLLQPGPMLHPNSPSGLRVAERRRRAAPCSECRSTVGHASTCSRFVPVTSSAELVDALQAARREIATELDGTVRSDPFAVVLLAVAEGAILTLGPGRKTGFYGTLECPTDPRYALAQHHSINGVIVELAAKWERAR